MIIDCISDLHGYYPKLEGGDLLIVAGDVSNNEQYDRFFDWLANAQYRKKVYIAGNHDNNLFQGKRSTDSHCDATYLCDSGTEFVYYPPLTLDNPPGTVEYRQKLKIWGSPWTKSFPGMNPKCKAFTVDTEEELAEKWALIPEDTGILITHSPPYGLLDVTKRNECVGSVSLRNRAFNLPNIKLFVFGHVHEMGGRNIELTCMRVVNAAHVDENYKPVNPPIRIEI